MQRLHLPTMVIVEKPAKEKGGAGSRHARSLARYMEIAKRDGQAHEFGLDLAHYLLTDKSPGAPEERVIDLGGLTQGQKMDWAAARDEMERRLALRSSRSKKPARHVIASVHGDEILDGNSCSRIAMVLAEELDCTDALILWALHGDTDNLHPHLLVLTLDQEGRATPFGPGGLSHEAMQRACARLEYELGLRSEPGARYVADAHNVRRVEPIETKTDKAKHPSPSLKTLQWEEESGVESFTRFAQKQLAPLLHAAQNWSDAQTALAEHGVMAVQTGSGGELRSADGLHHVKMSVVDRKLSMPKLIKKWGPWTAPEPPEHQFIPRIIDPERAGAWATRDQHRADACGIIQERIARLMAEKLAAVTMLEAERRICRAEVAALEADPAVIGVGALQSAVSSMFKSRIADVRAQYDARITALRQLRAEIDEFPDPAAIDLPSLEGNDASFDLGWAPSQPGRRELRGYRSVEVGNATQYWSIEEGFRQPAFVERGNRIWLQNTSDATLRAALLVARDRHGDVAAFGGKDFIRQAQRLGAELGIPVQARPIAQPEPVRKRSRRAERWYPAIDASAGRGQNVASHTADPSPEADRASTIDRDVAPSPVNASDGYRLHMRLRRRVRALVAQRLARWDGDPGEYRERDTSVARAGPHKYTDADRGSGPIKPGEPRTAMQQARGQSPPDWSR